MTRKGFRQCVFALCVLKILMAWKTSRKRPKRSAWPRGEGEAALRGEFKGLRSENFKAVYLGVGLFLARSDGRRPADQWQSGAKVSVPSLAYLARPPRRLGSG